METTFDFLLDPTFLPFPCFVRSWIEVAASYPFLHVVTSFFQVLRMEDQEDVFAGLITVQIGDCGPWRQVCEIQINVIKFHLVPGKDFMLQDELELFKELYEKPNQKYKCYSPIGRATPMFYGDR